MDFSWFQPPAFLQHRVIVPKISPIMKFKASMNKRMNQ